MTQFVLFQFFPVLNGRSFQRSIVQIPMTDNPYLFVGLGGALLAHLGALHVPVMQRTFATEPLSLAHWGMVTAIGLLIVVMAEIDKALLRRPAHEARVRSRAREQT